MSVHKWKQPVMVNLLSINIEAVQNMILNCKIMQASSHPLMLVQTQCFSMYFTKLASWTEIRQLLRSNFTPLRFPDAILPIQVRAETLYVRLTYRTYALPFLRYSIGLRRSSSERNAITFFRIYKPSRYLDYYWNKKNQCQSNTSLL